MPVPKMLKESSMNSDSRYTENELLATLSKYGGWDKDSISKLASSVVKTIIPGAFSNEELRLRTKSENTDCKPLKSFGLELLKMESRTGRSPFVCGMRTLIPKSSPERERNMRLDMNSKHGELKVIEFYTTGKSLPIPVDDIYLLGNSQKREDARKLTEQAAENVEIKKGRGR
jgi:hypothetical protein